jgi:acetylxylan esterase
VRRRLLLFAIALLTAAGGFLAVQAPAQAAALTEITGFGANPSNLRMYAYVPDRLAAAPGLLVAIHYCTGTGPAMYSGTNYAQLADRYGFIVIYPSVTRSSQCFDVASPQVLTRGGGSDPVGIKSMIDYMRQRYPIDAGHIAATGISSGAMMTNVLLGLYPDVFSAGSAWSGVPFGCFATTNGSEWNSDCANGLITKTSQQWGDLVRNAYPGYTGARPRMQLWHGTLDDTLRYPNFGEAIKQWTNVAGLPQTPTFTDTPQTNYTRTRYGSSGDRAPVEAISLAGYGHNLPVDGAATIHFLGLDTTTPSTSPSAGASPSPSSSATGGACRVGYGVNAWNTGFTASVTVTNTGTTAVNGWTLAFTLPAGQTVTSAWNATVSPSGGAVTARDVAYNAVIAPGGSATFGFQATHTGGTGAPAAFTLNGAACAL